MRGISTRLNILSPTTQNQRLEINPLPRLSVQQQREVQLDEGSVVENYNAYIEAGRAPRENINLLASQHDLPEGTVTLAPDVNQPDQQIAVFRKTDYYLLQTTRLIVHNLDKEVADGGLTKRMSLALISDLSNRIIDEGRERRDQKTQALLLILDRFCNCTERSDHRFYKFEINQATRYNIVRALKVVKSTEGLSPHLKYTVANSLINKVESFEYSEPWYTRFYNWWRWSRYCQEIELSYRNEFEGELRRSQQATDDNFYDKNKAGQVIGAVQSSNAGFGVGICLVLASPMTGGSTAVPGLGLMAGQAVVNFMPSENQ